MAREAPPRLLTAARAKIKTASWLARLTSGSAFTSAFTRDSGSRAGREGPAAVAAGAAATGASSSSGAAAFPPAATGAAILATSGLLVRLRR